MAWEVELTHDFDPWWNGLTEDEQDRVAEVVDVLEEFGPKHLAQLQRDGDA